MFEWISNAIAAVVEAVTGGGSSSQPSPQDPCDVGNCLAAREARRAAAREVERRCVIFRILLAPLRTALWVLGRSVAQFLIGLLLIAVLGGVLGISVALTILAVAVAAYVISIVFVLAWIPVINAAGQFLGEGFQGEAEAIADMVQECPASCHLSTDPTGCSGVGSLPSTPWNSVLGLGRLNLPSGP